MVRHLISALSGLSDADSNASAVCDDDSSTTTIEHSLLVRIGTAIKLPRVVSPIQNARRQHLFHNHNNTPPSALSPERRSMPSRIFGSIASSLTILLSPQRRKNGQALGVADSETTATIASSSPRNGSDSKRPRTLSPPCNDSAITNSYSWGRCHLSEFAHFSVGDQFIIIIPADHKNDSKQSINQRKAVRDRIIKSVATVVSDDSLPNVYRAPHRTLTNAARNKEAHEHLIRHHGIERNKKVYIELRCCLLRYPHRDDFTNNTIPRKEIEMLFRQNEGVYISLLDYEQYEVNIRWNELPFIQVWQLYSRSDHRPPITIQSERGSTKYISEILSFYNCYKDDSTRMCELLLAHNEKKNDYLTRQLRHLENSISNLRHQSEHVTNVYNANVLRDEMTDERLPQFTAYADGLYYNAWVRHYSGFQPNTPLLDTVMLNDIYKRVETTFPMHLGSLKSMMFGKRSNQPKRANSQYNLDKRHVLVHYFFCLLRERDRHHLIYWAMVGTIALHYRGADTASFRNTLGRAATIDLAVAFDKLDVISDDTAPTRTKTLHSQCYLTNVLDNYNRFQKFSTQRCGTSGVFHNGIVHSAIRVNEFNRPRGALMTNPSNETWKVIGSSLSPTFEHCIVVAELMKNSKGETVTTATARTCTIALPSNDWKIVHLPGTTQVPITYRNQALPSSIRMNVPSEMSLQDLVMGDRSWMATIHSTPTHRSLAVRECNNLFHIARGLVDILSHLQDSVLTSDESEKQSDIYHDKCASFKSGFLHSITENNPQIHHHIRLLQKHYLEYFNESYHAVSQYMWMNLLAKDEMDKDELLLASIEILSQFGFIDNSSGNATALEGQDSRRIFQYGDVLTIQKLNQLNPHLLKKMTHIGQDARVGQLYSLFTEKTLRSHDYLHENIHRLQAIYKVYYPGFIEVCCHVISAKRVTEDPTKGTWRDHEHIVIKMVSALKRLRFNVFLSIHDEYECCDPELAPNLLWQIGLEYQEFCDHLCESTNENTRYVARFIEFIDRWSTCRDAVRVGDWVTLEVEAIDWLPIWGVMKKPLYQLETMRRMAVMYGMSEEELEYYRMNRFFRMHSNGNFMSYDDFCEKHNYAMKQCTNHPDIEVMCRKSKHLHAASRCAKLLFGYEGKTASSMPSTGDDVDALYRYFAQCKVFEGMHVTCDLDTSLFADNVSVETFMYSIEKHDIDRQRKKPFTDAENSILSSIRGSEEGTYVGEDCSENFECAFRDRDFEEDGDNQSITSTSTNGGDKEESEQCNKKRQWKKMNKLGARNLFSCNGDTFHDAVNNRIAKVKEEDKLYSTIIGSINYFNEKMIKKKALLQQRCLDRDLRIARNELPHEKEARCSRYRHNKF